MTSREMQKIGSQRRWAKLTPQERSKVMSKVREGAKKEKRAIKGNNENSSL